MVEKGEQPDDMIQTTSHSLHRIGSITQEKARTKIAYIVAES